jgi:protein phosphatase
MKLTIPDLCLVVLIGPSGAGKSSFARRHFKPTEVISSDFCRGLVSDDENDQAATGDAFDVLQYVVGKRLARGRVAVVDATNVQAESRAPLVELARAHDVLPVAIVLKLPEQVCHERNRGRADRSFGPHVVRNQMSQLRKGLRGLSREGFRYVYVLESAEEVEGVEVVRQPLWNNRRDDRGPFDIIGDVHGCYDELIELLGKLGYRIKPPMGSAGEPSSAGGPPMTSAALLEVTPPPGRKAVFLGDLVDRGPKTVDVLRLVRAMVANGSALCVPGNHDVKLVRHLRGRNVQQTHGLAETIQQMSVITNDERNEVADFLDKLVGHYVLDGGWLVVAHAGMTEAYAGRASQRVREFALYGETTGETDEFGLPVRFNWAAEYRGAAAVVYGHTPTPEADWLNNTICIDTGCAFGGKLTALRWPEREVVSVPARAQYAVPARPLVAEPPPLSAQQANDDVLDLADVVGKRIVPTRLSGNVTVRAENAAAALEVMSRFAADPRWLIYLPPTMSPCATSAEPGLLEHPREAFNYFLGEGVGRVVCQRKHMGSRAVAIVCRDEAVAAKRFGVSGESGILYTRTGRRFFDDRATETALLDILRERIAVAGLWDELASDWFCLDCELMPWSAKAQGLLREQYAAVGSAARADAAAAVPAVEMAAGRYGEGLQPLLAAERQRADDVNRYVEAYRRYCWPVQSVSDLRLAPFHLLAGARGAYADRDHAWHLSMLSRLADGGVVMATESLDVDVTDPASVAAGIAWWERLTGDGGEGMVVKPTAFAVRGPRGLVQPAVKCRGREYLRIIYGPEYTTAANLDRLRRRGLAGKRSLALREFALGIEGLERFVRREPLRRVHECAFAVLALESEPVDPRL